MVGFSMAVTNRFWPCMFGRLRTRRFSKYVESSPSRARSLRSSPVEKARSPAPVMMHTHTSGSADTRPQASCSSSRAL